MAVVFPPPLVPIAGASDREGRSRRNRHHWIAPSRGIIPKMFFLILIIVAHRGASTSSLFWKSTVRQCNTAPGRRRERSGACARAVPMGQGVGRVWRPPAPRVERARSFSDEFGRLGLTRARQPCSSGFSSMAGALGCLREALINGLRTGRVRRSSARCYDLRA
jgi:hypothetical protein